MSLYPEWDDRPIEAQIVLGQPRPRHLLPPADGRRRWQLQTFTCHGLMSSRGVSVGYVFTEDGMHVATIVQEVLVRKVRRRDG